MKILKLSFLLFICVVFCGCESDRLYKNNRVLMGTFVEVISPDKKAAQIVFNEIKRIEALLSRYDPQSEISKLNSLGTHTVNQETFFVIKKAKEFWELSAGAFDPTAGAILDLWGFTDKNYRVPADEEIQAALELVGMDKVLLDEQNRRVEFKNKKMVLDLGGLAKGYAVDMAVNKLKENNITSCLINAGGDIYCLGDKFGKPWQVQIKNPYKKGTPEILELKNTAVATSGNYEQYFIKKDKKYSHLIDPRSGYPVETKVFSVTVTSSDCLTADALATAVFVMGSEESWELTKNFPGARVKIFQTQ